MKVFIKCGDKYFDQIDLFNLTVKLSASPVRDLIECFTLEFTVKKNCVKRKVVRRNKTIVLLVEEKNLIKNKNFKGLIEIIDVNVLRVFLSKKSFKIHH
jgi:hypothetical protein